MNEKKDKLIKSIKYAVAEHGLSGITTRNIGDVAEVNDAYIYHYFKDKEDLLLQAYIYENGLIFNHIINELDEVNKLDVPFKEKAYISFVNVWKRMIENKEQLTYCVFYYHSAHFKNAEQYHNGQVEELQKRLGKYFENLESCTQTMYALCTLLYDSAYSVISGQKDNSEEYRNRVFEMEMGILKSQMKEINDV